MPYNLARSTLVSTSPVDRDDAREGELYGADLTTTQIEYLFAVRSLAMFHQCGVDAFHCALQRCGFPSGNYEV